MKKILFSLLFLIVFIFSNSYVNANPSSLIQDTVQVSLEDLEVEDSVSIDDMEPIFYEAEVEDEDAIVEDENPEKSNLLLYFAIGIVIIGGAAVLYSRSKKK
ncbi:MAG: hypothetical protein QNK30_06880 [Bacteroidales bacterium]|nr:hypothetical protein [Bacteroidales bacterium]